jgi:hypothetical protein
MSDGSMMIWMILEFTLDGKEAGTNTIKATREAAVPFR